MTITVLKAATIIAMPLLVAACAVPGFGDVDFMTSGAFTCGATAVGCSTSDGGTMLTLANNGNTLTIMAMGISNPGTVLPNDVNVITFNTTSTNMASLSSPAGVNTTGVTFTLGIDQTSPGPFNGTLGGSFSGSIDAKGSDTIVTFAPNQTALTLGGSTVYALDFLSPANTVWTIPNPGIGAIGVTTETASVTSTTVTPEPTFIMLSGLGFAGLAFVAYRRRQTI